MSNSSEPLRAPLLALGNFIEQGARLGIDMLESLADLSPRVLESFGGLTAGTSPFFSACEIPSPCWMPKPLCDVKSTGRAGDTGSLRFVITNCTMASRAIQIFTSTKGAQVSIVPDPLSLGPMERGESQISYVIPAGSPVGTKVDLLIWVRGCKLQFLRWVVTVGSRCSSSCCEVEVRDCPDFVHHWYDHFYCPRPCLGGGGGQKG
ncbi:MAG TPA: hypothetical protein VMG82_06900 [Candidatus Sulfotelmatobacter sp.]|nr:hypothetical protein [Candidatus Sulfotelmatobacter sp.]